MYINLAHQLFSQFSTHSQKMCEYKKNSALKRDNSFGYTY
ncbi:hypothetical protein SLEP1_g32943 [Rubroshorea leprosula]|uniref:Uncharacterized protein n=1 Tax=Rubroshorea leprosula TaxID=152421 RepID=A0AAV5KF14_9ROSI|nr:hypothetical protein SLEP1_g32943 [Rubroshorea leprosula]